MPPSKIIYTFLVGYQPLHDSQDSFLVKTDEILEGFYNFVEVINALQLGNI